MSDDFLHAFRLARMIPPVSAARWTCHHGIRVAEKIPSSPFAALRVLGTDLYPEGAGNPILFLVSSAKPTGIGEGCFITLTCSPPTSPREFQVSHLDPSGQPLYLHTSHHYIERYFVKDAATDGQWDTVFRIASTEKERLVKTLLEDAARISEHLCHRDAGEYEIPEPDWDTWSAFTKPEIRYSSPGLVYEHQTLEAFPCDGDNHSKVIYELACFKELSRDYLWKGVIKAVDWIESARLNSESLPAPMISDPSKKCKNGPKKDSESESGSDSDSDFEEAWGEHFFPRIPSFDTVGERPPVPTPGVKLLVFDLIGTILDRETAISKVIEALIPSSLPISEATTYRQRVKEAYIEMESIISIEDLNLGYHSSVRRALEDFAKRFGGATKDAIQIAESLIHSPPSFSDALVGLHTLSQEGYDIIFMSPFEERKVLDLLGEELPSLTRDRIRVLTIDNIYSPLSDGTLTSLLELATQKFDELRLSELHRDAISA